MKFGFSNEEPERVDQPSVVPLYADQPNHVPGWWDDEEEDDE